MTSSPPPPAARGLTAAAVVLGILIGSVAGLFGGLFALALGDPGGGCGKSVPFGIAELAVLAALFAATWVMTFRVKWQGFVPTFLRVGLIAVSASSLFPWPCSLGGATVITFIACH